HLLLEVGAGGEAIFTAGARGACGAERHHGGGDGETGLAGSLDMAGPSSIGGTPVFVFKGRKASPASHRASSSRVQSARMRGTRTRNKDRVSCGQTACQRTPTLRSVRNDGTYIAAHQAHDENRSLVAWSKNLPPSARPHHLSNECQRRHRAAPR